MKFVLMLMAVASLVLGAEVPSADLRLRRVRTLPEILVPVRGMPVVAEEDTAVVAAAESLAAAGPMAACDHLVAFWRRYPTSRWAPAVGVSAGILARREGLVAEAEELWRGTWERWQTSEDPVARRWAERAVGEYAQYLAWTGHDARLRTLLETLKSRDISGTAGARLESALSFLDFSVTDLVVVRKLAAYAPGRFLARHQPDLPAVQIYNLMRSTLAKLSNAYDQEPAAGQQSQGMLQVSSLVEVREVARSLGFPCQVARREPTASILVPAVVPLVNGHGVALVAQVGERFRIEDWREDPAYGAVEVLSEALLRSALTVWVVPEGPLPPGWHPVADAEAERLTSH